MEEETEDALAFIDQLLVIPSLSRQGYKPGRTNNLFTFLPGDTIIAKIKDILIECKFTMNDICNYKLNNDDLSSIDDILNDRKSRPNKKTF